MKRAIVIAALMLAFAARAQDAAPWWNAQAADGEDTYEVQYIGNVAGGGIIDTGLYGNDDLCVSIDIDKLDLTHDVWILGGTDAWYNNTVNFFIVDNKVLENRSYISVGPNGWLETYVVNARMQKYRIEPEVIRIWQSHAAAWTVSVARQSATFSTQITMPLFGAYYTATPDITQVKGTAFRVLGRVYFYSRSTGFPIKTLVPYCKNGKPCFYDEVNKSWLYEINGNGFYCGPKGTYNELTYVAD